MEQKGMPPAYTELKNSSPYSGGGSPSAPSYGFVNQEQPISAPIQQPAPPSHQSNVVIVNTPGVARGCPVCRNNSWTGTYSCLAWLCCIFCFPCGIICCCCMRKKKCNKCGFIIG